MNNVEAIVFDMDGTLVDTNSAIVKKWKCYAERMELEVPPEEEIIEKIGIPFEETVKLTWPHIKHDKSVFEDCEPEDKVNVLIKKSTLGEIKENFKVGVATSAHGKSVDLHLGNFKKNFDTIISSEDTKKHKPNSDPLLEACKRLEVKPENAIYLGDTIYDKKAAENANMRFIGVTTGVLSEEDYKKLNVEYIKNVNHLVDIIGDLIEK